MNGFLKFVLSLFALFTAAVGALMIVDKFLNKNRIEGDYLNCDTAEEEEI